MNCINLHKLLVGTRNVGKEREIQQLLADTCWQVVSLSNFEHLPTAVENGNSFTENALIKARYYHNQTGLLTLSEDSGLTVDALEGAPGIYSARYLGLQADDRLRCEEILRLLSGVAQREAQFVCVAALVGNNIEQIFTASVAGRIVYNPRGQQGFGYDPIFEYVALSKTFAELTSEEKSLISHRGKALIQVRDFLTALNYSAK